MKVIVGGSRLEASVDPGSWIVDFEFWILDCDFGFWILDCNGDEDDTVKAIVGGSRLEAGCACDECGEVRVGAPRPSCCQQAQPTPPLLSLVEPVAGAL